jgi:hypothetical protein
MPRVIPSQVVAFIDKAFPFAAGGKDQGLDRAYAGRLHPLLELLRQLPSELIVLDDAAALELVICTAAVESAVHTFENVGHGPALDAFSSIGKNPIVTIRASLARCPDQHPAPGTSELAFISDADLRRILRLDISAVERALSNGEWKAATVLAGSVIEALLLWKVGTLPVAQVDAARQCAIDTGALTAKAPKVRDLDEWRLHHFAEVVPFLGFLKADTIAETQLARRFRNLIHPAVTQRTRAVCDRGTARAAAAALEHLVRDLS